MAVFLNSLPIVHGTIHMPRCGAWVGDILVDSPSVLDGPVTIAADDGSWSVQGTAWRQGEFVGTLSLRAAAGAAGLSTAPGGVGRILPPKCYWGVTVRAIVRDVLAACGETLSPASDGRVLSAARPTWARLAGPGKDALRSVLERTEATWRVLPDGTVWFGFDEFPDAAEVEFSVLDRHFAEGRIQIGSDRPFLFPGQTLTLPLSAVSDNSASRRQQIDCLTLHLLPDSVRTDVYL